MQIIQLIIFCEHESHEYLIVTDIFIRSIHKIAAGACSFKSCLSFKCFILIKIKTVKHIKLLFLAVYTIGGF